MLVHLGTLAYQLNVAIQNLRHAFHEGHQFGINLEFAEDSAYMNVIHATSGVIAHTQAREQYWIAYHMIIQVQATLHAHGGGRSYSSSCWWSYSWGRSSCCSWRPEPLQIKNAYYILHYKRQQMRDWMKETITNYYSLILLLLSFT